jgi:DNA-directed RNA polymerase subunit E'/Rpb7
MMKPGEAPKSIPSSEKKRLLATDVEIQRRVVESRAGSDSRAVAQNRQNQQNYQNN